MDRCSNKTKECVEDSLDSTNYFVVNYKKNRSHSMHHAEPAMVTSTICNQRIAKGLQVHWYTCQIAACTCHVYVLKFDHLQYHKGVAALIYWEADFRHLEPELDGWIIQFHSRQYCRLTFSNVLGDYWFTVERAISISMREKWPMYGCMAKADCAIPSHSWFLSHYQVSSLLQCSSWLIAESTYSVY